MQCVGKVRVRSGAPDPPLAGEGLIAQVPGGELCAHRGAPAHVELGQGLRGRIARDAAVLREKACGSPRAREPRALECEERDLLGGIEPPEVRIELQTVDHRDARPRAEKHVLGTQVAVPVDETGAAPFEHPRVAAQELKLGALERRHLPGRKAKVRRAELACVQPDLAPQPRAVRPVAHWPPLGAAEERPESHQEAAPVAPLNGAAREERIEPSRSGESAHLDEPLDDAHARAARQGPIAPAPERNDPQVDTRGEPPIERKLGATRPFPGRERPIVHRGLMHRLFELERARAGEKHPCEVSLDDFHGARMSGEVTGIGEVGDFGRKIRRIPSPQPYPVRDQDGRSRSQDRPGHSSERREATMRSPARRSNSIRLLANAQQSMPAAVRHVTFAGCMR